MPGTGIMIDADVVAWTRKPSPYAQSPVASSRGSTRYANARTAAKIAAAVPSFRTLMRSAGLK